MSITIRNPLSTSFQVIETADVVGLEQDVTDQIIQFVTQNPIMTTVIDNEIVRFINTPQGIEVLTPIIKSVCCDSPTPTPTPTPTPRRPAPIYDIQYVTGLLPVTPCGPSSPCICRTIVQQAMDPWAYDARRNVQSNVAYGRVPQSRGFRSLPVTTTAGTKRTLYANR